ncbi:hypothetical protein Noc_2297 [Nitrosococcus oceani ATCC 19707]|uniref:Uncharacterized protein n=1 Tax=Nitrosococcus oceani (strain ATCC 19707 / BCRC 17464 / JCM 30415 / NCIMB 11848 / C-107) TaxID=323261 RepID=Q3J8U1_NITOC|nr:hypothetical protein Noc_2297 [Nitrosococcus oceani ATCC 19707]
MITTGPWYQGTSCRHQVSVAAAAIFHWMKAPLRKGFWAIDWLSPDKGWILALHLSKLLATATVSFIEEGISSDTTIDQLILAYY